MGLMARTTCRFSFTRSRKKLNMDSGVASILRPWERRGEERERGRGERERREERGRERERREREGEYTVCTTEGGGMQYTVRECLKVHKLSSHLCPCGDLHLLNDLGLFVWGE